MFVQGQWWIRCLDLRCVRKYAVITSSHLTSNTSCFCLKPSVITPCMKPAGTEEIRRKFSAHTPAAILLALAKLYWHPDGKTLVTHWFPWPFLKLKHTLVPLTIFKVKSQQWRDRAYSLTPSKNNTHRRGRSEKYIYTSPWQLTYGNTSIHLHLYGPCLPSIHLRNQSSSITRFPLKPIRWDGYGLSERQIKEEKKQQRKKGKKKVNKKGCKERK